MAPKTGTVAVMSFFGIPVARFRAEWAQLSEETKAQLKEGIGTVTDGVANGSLTY